MTGTAPGATARMTSPSVLTCRRAAGVSDAKYRRVCADVRLRSRIPHSPSPFSIAPLRHLLVDGSRGRGDLALLVVILVRVVDAPAVGRQHVDDHLRHLAA